MNSHHSIDASSIDLLERKKFDQLSSVWWDKKGPMWPLHKLNALRVEYILQILCNLNGFDSKSPFPLTGLRVLDVGCGGGILSESLARLGAHVHGIDISTRNIDVARQHSGGTGMPLTYDVTTAEGLAASGSRYDVV